MIRVQVQHLPKPTSRTKKTLWLWAARGAGAEALDLDTAWRAYLRRFDIEHTFRFIKNTLGWTTPRCAPPNRPTAGPGSCSPRTPSCASPKTSSRTNECPGSDDSNPAGSPPPASDEDFEDLAPPSGPRNSHVLAGQQACKGPFWVPGVVS